MDNIKNQIINSYLSQQMMTEECREIQPIDVPSPNELEEFKNCVKIWITVDNNIKKLQATVKEQNGMKKEVSKKILSFMSRFNIEDLNTKEGKLRYKVTQVKAPLSQAGIKEKIVQNYQQGMAVEDLTSKVFERPNVAKHSLRRFK